MSAPVTETPDRITLRAAWCKGCGLCVAVCPRECLQMVDGKPVMVNPDKCTGCGLCEQHCPDFALRVNPVRRKTERGNV